MDNLEAKQKYPRCEPCLLKVGGSSLATFKLSSPYTTCIREVEVYVRMLMCIKKARLVI